MQDVQNTRQCQNTPSQLAISADSFDSRESILEQSFYPMVLLW